MELEVLLGDALVGQLSHNPSTNRFAFIYDAQWLGRRDRFPLSPQLPLTPSADQTADTQSAAVRQYFENLLPEGQALDDAAATYRLSKANLMGLLAAIGKETAGALQLRVPGATAELALGDRRPLSRQELSSRIQSRPQQPFSVWDGKVRLSIAGYQDKIAVYQDGSDWYLVEGGQLCSTHILKPEPIASQLRGLTANEFLCMRLASHVKLGPAEVVLLQIPEPVLCITRFDRIVGKQQVTRRHIIDGCQALGLSAGFKYERPYGDSRDVRDLRDGANLPGLFSLLENSAHPAAQRLALLRWVIFQVLIGNTDAHAKNLSFFSGPEGLSLAPAYDLVCGMALEGERLEQTYALAIGDAFTADALSPFEWANFARTCGLNSRLVSRELQRMAQSVSVSLAESGNDALAAGAPADLVARITSIVQSECTRQANMAPEIVRVPAGLF